VDEAGLGARVDSLLPIETTESVLRRDDVLMRVGEYDVGSDGTVVFEGNRVFGSVAFQDAQHGEELPVWVWRGGEEVEVSLPMYVYEGDRLLGNQYDVLPRYYVHAGLVFTPLSQDFMKTFGRDWRDLANTELIYELYYRRSESPQTARPEPVVLASTMAHPVNANLRFAARALVDRINGVRIERLEDVIKAIESGTASHHVIELLPNQAIETLHRADAEAAHAEILETYGISQDRRL
jgi:hypothetical protein